MRKILFLILFPCLVQAQKNVVIKLPTFDTTTLNRKVNYTDTAAMLLPYQRALTAMKYNDTAAMLSPYLRSFLGVKYSDTATMLSNYRTNINALISDSSYQAAQIALRVKYADTASMLSNYYNKTSTDSKLALKVNYTDTSTMLSPYQRSFSAMKYSDTAAMLSAYYNKTAVNSLRALDVKYTDTASMLSPYARSLSLGAYVPYTGATSNLNLGTYNYYGNNYFNGFTSVAASGTLITLTTSSTPSYLITGSGGQTIQLPNATTLPNGAIYYFNNNQTTGAISVNNNSTTLVKSVPSGAYLALTLIDNSTAAGSWDAHFEAPSNVSWSTNTLDYAGSITSATWNGTAVAILRGGTGASTAATALSNLGGLAKSDTATMLSPYLRGVGYGLSSASQFVSSDTTKLIPYTDTLKNYGMASQYYVLTHSGTYSAGRGLNLTGSSFSLDTSKSYTWNPSVTAASAIARGSYYTPSLTAAANNDVLVGLDINPTFTNGAFTGVTNYGFRSQANANIISNNSNASTYLYVSNTTAGSASYALIRAISTGGGLVEMGKYSSSSTAYGTLTLANDAYLTNYSTGNLVINGTPGTIKFCSGAFTSAQMTLFTTGNFGIGTTSDNATDKLQVTGTGIFQLNQNGNTGISLTNTTYGTASQVAITLTSDNSAGVSAIGKYSSTKTATKNITAGSTYFYNSSISGNIAFLNDFATGNINFATGGSSTAQATLFSTGNLAIGSTTDNGTDKLQVTGSSKFTGAATFNGSAGYTGGFNVYVNNGVASAFRVGNYGNLIIDAGGNAATALSIGNVATFARDINYPTMSFTGTTNTIGQYNTLGTYNSSNNSSTVFVVQQYSGSTSGLTFAGNSSGGLLSDQYLINLRHWNGNLTFGNTNATQNYTLIDADIVVVPTNTGKVFRGIRYRPAISGTALAANYAATFASGQVGIGTETPLASALLEVTSTTQGVLPPRMTTTQKLAISSPAEGLQVYDLTLHQTSYYNGTVWINF